ncbi:hypothetical protein ILUMI_08355 [Ignelater luminosus]|uniref:Integrase catalytic domain-containing protein n=1 Tax=Ignelater luminosus TaxID=2038154 RepID=A0A8K0DBG9_IGNLU|nr:hypothetical protein ILUMI_08355 [Ignelater luminosus]
MGQQITVHGLSPDDSKIKVILEMPSSTNRKELQRFLGMVTYDIEVHYVPERINLNATNHKVMKIQKATSKDAVCNSLSFYVKNGWPLNYRQDLLSKLHYGPFGVNKTQDRARHQEWEFRHITSSPLYPQSNELVERNVQIVKKSLIKAKQANRDMYLVLLQYINSPIEGINLSPAQLLMARTLREILPINQ